MGWAVVGCDGWGVFWVSSHAFRACVHRAWCILNVESQSTAPRKVQAFLSTGSPSLSSGKGRLELSVDRVSVCMVLLCCASMQWV